MPAADDDYRGGCHCGNIRLAMQLADPPGDYRPRKCDCNFCVKHQAAYLSDPKGALDIHIRDMTTVSKYRQGSAMADCLICRRCGVLFGATFEENGQIYATVNCRVIDGDPGFGDDMRVSPKKLGAEEKRQRWQAMWFSNVTITIM